MKCLSLGYSCQTVAPLYRLSKINIIENPFQSMVSYNLLKLVQTLENNLSNFFEETEITNWEHNTNYLKVKDIKNDFVSIHDFTFCSDYSLVKNKLKTSGLNMLSKIKTTEELVLIFRRNHKFELFESSIELYKYLKHIRKRKPFILTIFQDREFVSEYKDLFFIKENDWRWDLENCDWIGTNGEISGDTLWMEHLKFIWNRTYCL